MEKREELRELRFKVSEKQLKDVRSIREIKKAIAQILTLINQKREKTTNK
jgi:ribosomal protein L29